MINTQLGKRAQASKNLSWFLPIYQSTITLTDLFFFSFFHPLRWYNCKMQIAWPQSTLNNLMDRSVASANFRQLFDGIFEGRNTWSWCCLHQSIEEAGTLCLSHGRWRDQRHASLCPIQHFDAISFCQCQQHIGNLQKKKGKKKMLPQNQKREMTAAHTFNYQLMLRLSGGDPSHI